MAQLSEKLLLQLSVPAERVPALKALAPMDAHGRLSLLSKPGGIIGITGIWHDQPPAGLWRSEREHWKPHWEFQWVLDGEPLTRCFWNGALVDEARPQPVTTPQGVGFDPAKLEMVTTPSVTAFPAAALDKAKALWAASGVRVVGILSPEVHGEEPPRRWDSGTRTVTIVAVLHGPAWRRNAAYDRGFTRLETDKMRRGSQPVLWDGRIVGYAEKMGGALRCLKAAHAPTYYLDDRGRLTAAALAKPPSDRRDAIAGIETRNHPGIGYAWVPLWPSAAERSTDRAYEANVKQALDQVDGLLKRAEAGEFVASPELLARMVDLGKRAKALSPRRRATGTRS